MKKAIPIVIAIIIILGGLVAVLLLRPADSAVPITETMQTSTPESTPENVAAVEEPATEEVVAPMQAATPPESDMPQSVALSAGRYTDYSASLVAASGYSETILFFHAAWCPECRAFEQAIKAESIPDGVQILKVDYDNSDDLRQKYGVTIQSTFVKVNTSGDRVTTWVGYGRDKSLSAVLENT